ncbi:hypothetical protein EMIT0P171_30447 [Pseudomonas sp. IT-P171]
MCRRLRRWLWVGIKRMRFAWVLGAGAWGHIRFFGNGGYWFRPYGGLLGAFPINPP